MENHAARPEFAAALKGKTGSDMRKSNTLGVTFMYVAVPAGDGALRARAAFEGNHNEGQRHSETARPRWLWHSFPR